MLCHRGVKLRTVDTHYRRILEDLFKEVGSDPSRYDAACLRRFVLKQGRRYSTTWTQNVASAVRVFVRFLIATGRCPPSLAGAIPSIASWRLSALPRYLPPTEVNLLLRSCLPNSRTGLRDRAVLLLLSRLGLRAKDIVDLRVDDIDWTEGSLSVEGKTRRRDRLPLPQDVGDAILAYLERGRPFVDCEDHLFLTAKAPWTRLGPSNTVSSVVRRAIRRAGIKAPSSGAHMLRHSAATQMLRKGSSLQAIAWVLRHRSLETTAIYAKVDTGALKRIAQPWPEATSC
jgi:site-specific recombinase XerD